MRLRDAIHVFWNQERDRPQLLHAHDEAGLEALVRLGFPHGVPGRFAGERTALPGKVVSGSVAHAAARERLVADLQRTETALAEGLMLVVDPHAGWETRVFLREGERTYHLAIEAGRGGPGSLRPVSRGELFEGVQKAGGALQPTPPAAREDVRSFLQEPPFAPRR